MTPSSGFLSSEFWKNVSVIVAALLTTLVTAGLLSPSKGQELTATAGTVIAAIGTIAIAVSGYVAANYTKSRTQLKIEVAKANGGEPTP